VFSHVALHNTVINMYIIYSNIKNSEFTKTLHFLQFTQQKVIVFRIAIKSTCSYNGKDRRFLRGYESILKFLGQLELVHIRTYLLNECKASLNTESASNIYDQSLLNKKN
jgi:hypothetical protein